jgi:ATP-binding cassette, subfamily F, member 3
MSVQATYKHPHVLLLDEPSNHLDMDAVDALIEGLSLYKGGVLMVSHDQWLIEATMNELWMCEQGTIDVFHGSFDDYKARLRAK